MRPVDPLIYDIAHYVATFRISSARARRAVQLCLTDSLACAFEALRTPECMARLGPVAPGTLVPNGARVPGTPYVLDPVDAAFSTSTLIRWLDYNDACYGETVIHPSDCIGAILSVADWQSRSRVAQGRAPLAMRDVLDAMIRAYELMGQLALANAFTTRMGIDHVALIKIGSAAVATQLLGGTRDEIMNAVSNAWLDGQPLALFRRGPEAGARKSWAAGDAAARGVRLALMAMRGEMGYPLALSAKTWGFCAVLNKGRPLKLLNPARKWGSSVIEKVQFKICYPAGVHAQSAAEAAIRLHTEVAGCLDRIERIEVRTHRYAHGILNRSGALRNFAERDHSLQYIVAIGLIFGRLESSDYEDAVAADPRIDRLRARTVLTEHAPYTQAFYDPARRANPNAIRVTFNDGTRTEWLEVFYPIGHPQRRDEGLPLLQQKFEHAVAHAYTEKRRRAIITMCSNAERLAATPVNEFMGLVAG